MEKVMFELKHLRNIGSNRTSRRYCENYEKLEEMLRGGRKLKLDMKTLSSVLDTLGGMGTFIPCGLVDKNTCNKHTKVIGHCRGCWANADLRTEEEKKLFLKKARAFVTRYNNKEA